MATPSITRGKAKENATGDFLDSRFAIVNAIIAKADCRPYDSRPDPSLLKIDFTIQDIGVSTRLPWNDARDTRQSVRDGFSGMAISVPPRLRSIVEREWFSACRACITA